MNAPLKPNNLCEICHSNAYKYSCPRCNLQYCSLICYKSSPHQQCSEQFYQECVTQELATMDHDPESKRSMAELLLKMKNQLGSEREGNVEGEGSGSDESGEDSDDYNDDDISCRFDNIDLDDSEGIWNQLTDKQKRDFSEMLASANILQILPPWTPWWTEGGDEMPEVTLSVPQFSTLTRCQPSPNMSALVLNTLTAYQMVARGLRGEVHGMCVEAATIIWNASSTLRGELDACKACRNRFECNRLIEVEFMKLSLPPDLNISYKKEEVLKDQELLLKKVERILTALSEVHCIFEEAEYNLREEKSIQRFTGDPPSSSSISKAKQKIRFYSSWAATTGVDVWDSLLKPITIV